MHDESPAPRQSPQIQDFATTRWSLIVAAGDEDSPTAQSALEALCSRYWYPLYAFIRRRGYRSQEAEDLTQSFFAMLLVRRDLAKADPARGRFRTFLLTALKHFLSNQQVRERAKKRGGDHQVLSLDFPAAERRYSHEPAVDGTPENWFDKQWALELLESVGRSLRAEYAAAGKEAMYVRLNGVITGEATDNGYAILATELGMSVGAVKVAVHRLRQRFGKRLREQIADTVANPDDVDAEICDLFQILRAG